MGPLYRSGEFTLQMTAGPARYRDFKCAGVRFATGAVRLMAMGILRDALPDRTLFDHPEQLSAFQLILHLQSPTLALYLWISGYVDWSIAIGRLLGFQIPDNFNYPWRSLSIGEFWRRWHITLSNWLKDYLFIPLVRHRWHYFWSFTFTFLFCGFWHGLYASYILFGLSQGVGLAVHRWWDQFWRVHRDRRTPLYLALLRVKLVQSPLNMAACWLLTYSYLVLAIDLAADERNTFLLVARRILSLLGLMHS
jgi:D-alanyl-lipoteichoic acid acyltransferase DltB (MBOAT superfamily)